MTKIFILLLVIFGLFTIAGLIFVRKLKRLLKDFTLPLQRANPQATRQDELLYKKDDIVVMKGNTCKKQ